MPGIKEQFETSGFVILPNALDLKDLEAFENRIRDHAHQALAQVSQEPLPDTAPEILRQLSHQDKVAFHQACRSSGTSLAGMKLVMQAPLLEAVSELFEDEIQQLYPTTPAVFWNDPQAKVLQYDWHQESSYYPGRKTSFHVWFPVFRDLERKDGPMVVCQGSHKEAFPYEKVSVPGGLTQLKVADEIADRFEQVDCSMPRGAAILFHPHLIHKTLPNDSGIPRTSGIIRYFALAHDHPFKAVIGPAGLEGA